MDGAEQLGQGGFLAVLLVFSERPGNGRMPPNDRYSRARCLCADGRQVSGQSPVWRVGLWC